MQLPRGTFREIKKGQKLGDLLEELGRSRFSGICSISFDESISTLVMKSGKCILAKYAHFAGDAAYDELGQMPDQDVDAALSTLDEAQLQLALEFNKAARIIKTGKAAPVHQKPAEPAPHIVHQTVEKVPAPVHTARVAPVHATPGEHSRPVVNQSVPDPTPSAIRPGDLKPARHQAGFASETVTVHPKEPPKAIPEEEEDKVKPETSSFEKDIDTFDTMDISSVTDKIRNDCRTMVKQLHLDHLMERK
ncbi:MAG: hypothetical protein WC391_01485 [Methanoregula sp.]|jgi:hypothetical protein